MKQTEANILALVALAACLAFIWWFFNSRPDNRTDAEKDDDWWDQQL